MKNLILMIQVFVMTIIGCIILDSIFTIALEIADNFNPSTKSRLKEIENEKREKSGV
jgi:hypothetical protein